MALFCIIALDNPGALDKRVAVRPEHVAYLNSRMDIIRLAGPQLDAEGKMCGSLMVIEVADRAAAEAFSNGDPFKQQGVFGQVEIRGFNATLGSWVS